MSKIKTKHKIIAFFSKCFTYIFLNLLGYSLKFEIKNLPDQGKYIFAFWHKNILPLMYLHRNQKIGILISSSADGEYVAGPAKAFGFLPIRGSSNRDAVKAFKEMLKFNSSSIALTPDGPKGPYKTVKKGVLFLSYMTKLPIIGVIVDVDKSWKFKSWDKFRIPKPGTKINVTYTDPVYIKTKEEIEEKLIYLQDLMRKEKE